MPPSTSASLSGRVPLDVASPAIGAGERNRPWWAAWQLDPAAVLAIAARFVVIGAGIVTSIMTARFLLPAGRGEYFLIVTTAQMMAQFCNLGLASSNTYFVARDRTLFSGLFANTAWVAFLAVPVAGALILAVATWAGATPGSGLQWFAVLLAPLIVFNLLGSNLFVGLNQIKTFSLVQAASAAVVLPLMVIAGFAGAGPAGFLTASVIGWATVAALIMWLLRRQSSSGLGFRGDVFTSSLKYSVRAYLATLAGFVVLRMNVFTLHAIVGPEQVGYYSVASQIADTLSVLPQSIALVLFPKLVASEAGRLEATVRDAIRTAGLMALVCGVMWVAAEPAIRLAFGPDFAPAVAILRAMLPGVLLLGVMAIVSQYLAASGFPLSVVGAWLAAVALAGTLGRALIVRFGAVGAGMTLSVTYGVLLVTLALLCWRMAATRPPAGEPA